MKIEQTLWTATRGWEPGPPGRLAGDAQLVFVFSSTSVLRDGAALAAVRHAYPAARLFGCSTAGEICGARVLEESLACTAVQFAHTRVTGAWARVREEGDSFQAGEHLARRLDPRDLTHVLVLSDGLTVNGSELVRGLGASLPEQVRVTGGLSGDGERFRETLVLCDGEPERGAVAIVGLHGGRLAVGYGSLGGWDPFGPERLITRSRGNVLYELDGRSALELYKTYLGEHASGLPATGLLFPLSLRTKESPGGVVRTILAVNEEDRSLTFAGDMPEGAYARLMKANFDRLIDGAVSAARTTHLALGDRRAELALLISCVGRRLVLKQRIEEEVEGVRDVLGPQTRLTGFYSYGEISPFAPNARCELHNQTMTITALAEV